MPQFTCRGDTFEYAITRSDRKTLGIYFHPELRIEIRVPQTATESEITERVHKRRNWIVKQ
jgi:predicted metal-dependent hydrolase